MKRILIADDKSTGRELVRTILENDDVIRAHVKVSICIGMPVVNTGRPDHSILGDKIEIGHRRIHLELNTMAHEPSR